MLNSILLNQHFTCPVFGTYCFLCLENPSLAFSAPCLPLIVQDPAHLSPLLEALAEYPRGTAPPLHSDP